MTKKTNGVESSKRAKISQTDFPNVSLESSLRIAEALWENYAGKPTAPHNVALALDLSPTSGGWRNLCGASIAYGLTEGGYAANEIALTDLGKRVVAPTVEGDDQMALCEAALTPRVPKEFYEQYDRAKFPREDIAANVLVGKGMPKSRSDKMVGLLKENGQYVGFILSTKTGLFVSIDVAPNTSRKTEVQDSNALENEELGPDEDIIPSTGLPSNPIRGEDTQANSNQRVFITHGKDQAILDQIKEVVDLAGFTPVISIREETHAKPISDKVLDDMRSCGAAVIHVGSEGMLKDDEGNEHLRINHNVLIEIGAAMALYNGRFILVVEDGVKLPSNLSGLYESRYKGVELQFSAGMKILKAIRGLQENI